MKKLVLKAEGDRKRAPLDKTGEYVEKLSKMIGCKTVWTENGENNAEFERFHSLLPELFPNLVKRARKLTFGGGCFVFVIEGKNAKKNIISPDAATESPLAIPSPLIANMLLKPAQDKTDPTA